MKSNKSKVLQILILTLVSFAFVACGAAENLPKKQTKNGPARLSGD